MDNSTTVNVSSPYMTCPKMVTKEPYTLYENGTLEFHNRGILLPDGEYQFQGNDSVKICALTDPYVSRFGEEQNILTFVCITISLVGLFLKIVLHFADPTPKKVAQMTIASLSIALFMAQLLYLVGAPHPEWGLGCTIVGILIHYFFLASFFWSNTLAYDIWRTFTCVRTPKSPSSSKSDVNKKFLICSLYAWLAPLVIIAVACCFNFLPVDFHGWSPDYGQAICWFSNRQALLAFFAAPLASLLMINICFFFFTAYKIAQAVKDSKFAHQNTGKKDYLRFGLYVKLALIMGLTWTFGFVAPFSGSDVMWYLFIVFNGLQGAFIFLAFTQFKKLWKSLVVKNLKGRKASNLSDNNNRLSSSSRNNLTTSTTNLSCASRVNLGPSTINLTNTNL